MRAGVIYVCDAVFSSARTLVSIHARPVGRFGLQAGLRRGLVYKRLVYNGNVQVSIELDREEDGRWIAEALELPGVMTYGTTPDEAICNTERLAIEVIADRIQHGELPSSAFNISFLVVREQLAGVSSASAAPTNS